MENADAAPAPPTAPATAGAAASAAAPIKPTRKRVKPPCLLHKYENSDADADAGVQVGVDEAGRGPLFGRVYAAAVVLPPPPHFDHSLMRDSKRFTSPAKIQAAAAYIKEHAAAWSVRWEDEATIDRVNIRVATHMAMHAAVRDVLDSVADSSVLLVVDGNDFTPLVQPRSQPRSRSADGGDIVLHAVPHVCVEGGDNKFSMIAAASILAKVERDAYVADLCAAHPQLAERYELHKNKGYGAKRHMDGIIEHGVSQWHRKTFGACKTARLAVIE